MRSTEAKIKALEGRMKGIVNQKQLVTVAFEDGSRRVMPLLDVVFYIWDNAWNPSGPDIVSVEGENPPGSGKLMELVQELLSPPPEEVTHMAEAIIAEQKDREE